MLRDVKGRFIKGMIPWNKNKDCKHYNWGRKKKLPDTFCIDCGIKIYFGGLRCRSCYKKNRENKNFCIDCGKEIGYRAKRCHSCTNKYRWSKKEYKKRVRKKISLARGGTGAPVKKERYNLEFTEGLKEQVRFRDGYKCKLCGCSQVENGEALSVHHIDYNKKNSVLGNLVALCKGCHSKTNTNRAYWKKEFEEMKNECWKFNQSRINK